MTALDDRAQCKVRTIPRTARMRGGVVALVNDIDLADIQNRLQVWAVARCPTARSVAVHDVEMPHSTGLSMTSVMFAVSWQADGEPRSVDLVARVAPSGPGLLYESSLEREFAVMKALSDHTDVRVPRVRCFESDSAPLGSPFIVMDRVQGEVPTDDPPYTVAGWVTELLPTQRRALFEGAVAAMAQVHAVDWRALGLGLLDRPQYGATGIDQQIGYWSEGYEWAAEGARHPTVEAALQWTRDRRPADEEITLCWGDSRIGNIIYDPLSIDVAAVIDWEMVTLASPELDLGWCAFICRLYSEGIGVIAPKGLPSRAEMVAMYEQLTGRQVRHIDFYEAFAALRLTILMMRVGKLMISNGALPPDSAMPINNPVSQLLATLTGGPTPDGHAEWIVGNR